MNAILFDEGGTWQQCAGCNMFKSGAKLEYREWMLKRYGETEIQRLMALSHTIRKFTKEELLTLQESLLFQIESLNPNDELLLAYKKKAAKHA